MKLYLRQNCLATLGGCIKGGDLFPQLQSRVDSETSQREYAHMQRLDYETAANGKQNLDFNLSLTQGALEYRRVYD